MAKNAFDEINKKYGSGTIHKLTSEFRLSTSVIPTGSLNLDVALGVGGIPTGRIIEIVGPESSGKSTLCQHIVANCQALGGTVAYIDVENALDPTWMETCGIDVNECYIVQPDYGEQALDIVQILLPSVNLVIVDSVAALVPKSELEGEIGDSHMAVQARLMGQALRILNGGISKHNCTVIFTNQLREKIGVTYGSNETTPGGNALKYYASVRLDVRRKSTILKGEIPIGNEAKVTVKKNKVGAPFKVTGFEIYYDEGISKVSEILEYAVNTGLILKAGAGWYTIFPETEKQQKIQGTEAVRQVLKENPVICNEIENKIRESFNLPLIM